MPDVFVSYASDDRERVLGIVESVRGRGIELWIDRYKIPGGSQWSSEIVRAIKGCRVFLLITSHRALASENVRKEIDLAASESKTILPLWIEPDLIYPDHVIYHLKGIHYIVFDDDTAWIEQLFEAFRRTGLNVLETAASTRAEPSTPRSAIAATTALMPYLVDRAEQERRIAVKLQAHIERNARRPLLFVLHGDASQFIDGFIRRLSRHTLPHQLKLMGLPDQLEWREVFWPKPADETDIDSVEERASGYRFQIATALELTVSAKLEVLVRRIADYRQPVVFSSIIHGEDWQPDEPRLLAKVLEFWARLPELANAQPLIVFLAAVFKQSSATLVQRWFARRSRPEISQILPVLREFESTGLEIAVLPELVNISLAEVEHWVREVINPDDLQAAIESAKQSFDRTAGAGKPLSMEQLLPILNGLLPATARLRGS